MPKWDNSEGATNEWHLAVIAEDEKGQRVSSNEIVLTLTPPLVDTSDATPRWELMAPDN